MTPVKDTNIKDKSETFGFLVAKTEKLATATYILTESLKDAEPLKWYLRDKSLSLLSGVLSQRLDETAQRSVSEILSLIELALAGRLVSEQNFNILRREYQALREGLLSGRYRPENLDFSTPVLPPPSRQTRTFITADHQTPAATGPLPGREERTRRILDLLRAKGPAPIKDLAQALPGLGAKTVQRELNRLVSTGLVKREGERRWSRYQLAS